VLGLKWDKVHDEACLLEHATSPVVERRLAEVLNKSDTCPHGFAIPGASAGGGDLPVLPLSALGPGRSARVVSVEEDGGLLRQLEKMGIKPSVVVRREDAPDQDGKVGLVVGGKRRSLEGNAAARIKVLVLSPEETAGEAESTVPLSDLVADEVGVVKDLGTGRTFVSRCLALGFTPGVLVRMVQNFGHGPVIVLVRDTRVALGRGQAQKIHVVKKGGACASAG
jgi:Fe2+ transport system protein FeoA